MELSPWAEAGIGVAAAFFIISKFIDFAKVIKGPKNGNGVKSSESNARMEQIVSDTKAITIETNDRVKGSHTILSRIDGEGVNMVYTPRSIGENQKEIVKGIQETSQILRDVSNTQKQMADTMQDIRNQCAKHTD